MKRIREILRLCWVNGLSHSSVATAVGISSSTVHRYVAAAKAAGLTWDLVQDFSDTDLERLLFPSPKERPSKRAEPDWNYIHNELKRKGVTLILLWQEYKEEHPVDGYQLSQFCDNYRRWREQLHVSMRQNHRAGEKVFSDFAGAKLRVIDAATGVVREVSLFVSALGASNYTFADVFYDQSTESWCQGQARAFEFFGGSTEIIVPDNAKGAVIKPSRYEPELNSSFREMARYFGCAVIPARVRRPKDKSKVELAVGIATRWIVAKLRNRDFFSLEELRAAIRPLVDQLNERPFKKMPGSRKTAFEALDKPALKPLPGHKYQYFETHLARVPADHHIQFDKNWYSVPHQLIRKQVELVVTPATIEVLHAGKRVAIHARSHSSGQCTTLDEHRPPSHREYAQRTPERITAEATRVGVATKLVVEAIFQSDCHPYEALNRAGGILRLGKVHGNDRLEAACLRAVENNAIGYRSVKSILHRKLDKAVSPRTQTAEPRQIQHENIRGASYFSNEETEYVDAKHA